MAFNVSVGREDWREVGKEGINRAELFALFVIGARAANLSAVWRMRGSGSEFAMG
jgi:hypothetical protein